MASSVWVSAAPYITTPVVLLFIVPMIMCMLVYFSAVLLYLYYRGEKLLARLREAYVEQDVYRAGREIIAAMWDFQVRTSKCY